MPRKKSTPGTVQQETTLPRSAPAQPAPASDGHGNGKGAPPVWKKRARTRGAYVEVAVFCHEVDQGQSSFTTHSITIDRSYRDDSGSWHGTRSLRRDDLLTAAHLLQRAYAWISEQTKS